MQINNSIATYNAPALGNRSFSTDRTDNTITGQTNTDKVTISREGRSINEKFQLIADKYDVTNISTTERIAMTQELNDSQLLPEGTMLLMMAPLSMDEDVNQKSNYLNTIRESFEVASKMGGSGEQLELKRQRLEILEHLSAISSSLSKS